MKQLSITLGCLILLSCKTSSQDSKLKHELGNAVETNARYAWTTQPIDELLNDLDLKSEAERKNVFPSDAPMVQRLQYWVDKIDAVLRAEDKTGMFSFIPKPTVRLVNYPEMNAFVKLGTLQFSNVKFSYSGADPLNFEATEKGVAYFNGNYLIDDRKGQVTVGEVGEIEKQLKRTYRMFSECELSLREVKGGIVVSPKTQECNVDPTIEKGASYTFMLPAVGSDFVVYTGLVKGLSEEEVVFVLAHELKHYYGAQVGVQGKDYFYRLTAENNGHEPVRDPTLDTLKSNFENAYKELVKSSQRRDYLARGIDPRLFTKIEGQKIHSYLAGTYVGITATYEVEIRNLETVYSGEEGKRRTEYNQKCKEPLLGELKDRCETLNREANEYSVKRSSLGSYRGLCNASRMAVNAGDQVLRKIYNTGDFYLLVGELTPADISAYKSWESMVVGCLNYTKIIPDKDYTPDRERTSQRISASTMLRNFSAMRFGTPTTQLPPVEGPLGTFLVEVSNRMKLENKFDYDAENYKKAEVRWREIAAIETRLKNLSTELFAVGEGAALNKVGFYSVEQEADEAALEWMSKIGLDPGAGVRASMSLIHSQEARDLCEKHRKAGWKDESGNPLILPWGNFSLDNHPESCFRSRNLDMEISAHAYAKESGETKLLSSEEWTNLVSTLGTARDAAATSTGARLKLANALLGLEKDQSCRYAHSRWLSP